MAICNEVDFLGELPEWPDDCTGQKIYFNQLRAGLNNLVNVLDTLNPPNILLEQTTEPTKAQWETAFTVQTGGAPPITPNTKLIWYDTANLQLGGWYTVVDGIDAVYRLEHAYPKGSIHAYEEDVVITSGSKTANVAIVDVSMPSIEITIETVCDLYINAWASINASANPAAMDVLLDGVKLGTSEYGVASNAGMATLTGLGPLSVQIVKQNVLPGTYTIQMLLGNNTTGTGTISYGGSTYGPRILAVKAIVV